MNTTHVTDPVRSSRSRFLLTVGVIGALVASLLVTAAPAQAAYSVAFTPTGGAVGVPIALTSSVSSGAAGVGIGTVTYYAGGAAVAAAKVDAVGAVAPTTWTPMTAGAVAMYAAYASTDGSQVATSAVTTVTITMASTTTELTMPATAKVGSTVTIAATVTAGSYTPTGSVTFLLPSDVVLTAANVNAKGVATISVRMPDKASTYQLTARYNGDANANPSTSKQGSTIVTDNGSNVALSLSSATVAVGVSVTLTAAITPSSSAGSVTFYAGSTVLGSVTVSGGKAALAWRPATAGTVTLTSSFFPKGEVKPTGSDSLTVTVVGTLPVDTITLGPVGQAPWPAGSSHAMRYRTSIAFAASAKSGGAVSVTVTGPCFFTGKTLTANAGSGSCTMTARSPGSASLTAATQTYAIVLARGVQTANLGAPTQHLLQRGRYYYLGSGSTLTNAGGTVTWQVTYGTSRCKITRRADGSYQLRAKRLGRCNVRAYAPPVAGTWLRLSKYYKYRVVR